MKRNFSTLCLLCLASACHAGQLHFWKDMKPPMLFRAAALSSILLIAGCETRTPTNPDFDAALNRHLAAIQTRDLETFGSTLTSGDTLFLILPGGEALSTPAQARTLHSQWFADSNWVWEGEVVRKIVGADMATVLMRYDYRDAPQSAPRTSWLVLVFRLENNEWRLIHDQNTRIETPVASEKSSILYEIIGTENHLRWTTDSQTRLSGWTADGRSR